MTELKPRQRAHLRSLAQAVKPILQIGKEGVTEAVADTVEAALNNRELLKVRVLESAPGHAREMGDQLVSGIRDTHLIQVIGRIVVIYRRHPEKPEISLPE
ncbi:MAG TPA: YhbY family RNA-binding protein [Longimicrobiales bacterium]|nr:YhbY family RNA-binding protein [Longimicrobiales bacterium]